MVRNPTVLVMLLALAAPAFAQSATLEPVSRPGRLALGGGLNVVLVPGEGSGIFPFAQARVRVIDAVAVDLATHFYRGLEGFYQFRVRATPSRSTRVAVPYVTIGGVGTFLSHHVDERRTTLPTGDVVIYPAFRHNRLSKPFAFTGGGGAGVRLPGDLTLDMGAEAWVDPHEGGLLISMQTSLVVPLWRRKK